MLLLTDAAERRARLDRTQERFRLISQLGQDVLVVIDANGRVRWASDASRQHLQHRPEALIGTDALDLVHPDDRTRATKDLASVAAGVELDVPTIVRVRTGDGRYEMVEVTAANLLDEPAVGGIVLHIRIVTERVAAEQRLHDALREMERLTAVLGATSDLVAITSRTGKLLYVNDAFCAFFSVDRDDLADFDFIPVTPYWAQQVYAEETIPALRAHGLWQGEFAYFRAGVEVPMSALFISHRDEEGHLEFVSSITRDISDRKALEERLAHQATHDDLTGLANRALLLDHLRVALSRSERAGSTIGLLFVDLDHLKRINDTHGHRVGDDLLVAVAERLRVVVRPSDIVSRFGGDEFVILCDHLPDRDTALDIATRVGAALREPIELAGVDEVVTGSIGLALATEGGDPDALLRAADAAMYRAKQAGRDRFELSPD